MVGKFVSFEGIDSSGKSTLMDAVGQEVGTKSISGFSDSVIGDGVQRLRDNEWMMRMEPIGRNAYSELYMFISEDIYQYENRVRPHLESGKTVLKERQIPSKLAYQLYFINQEFNDSAEDILESVFALKYLSRILPNHIVFLYTPMEKLIPRIERIDSRTVTEDEREILSSVQENYKSIKEYLDESESIDCTTHFFNTGDTTVDTIVEHLVESLSL